MSLITFNIPTNISGGTSGGTVTVNNGLTKSGSNIHLGGTLTGVTRINGSTYGLDLKNIGVFSASTANGFIRIGSIVDGYGIELISVSGQTNRVQALNGGQLLLSALGGGAINMLTEGGGITISDSSSGGTTITALYGAVNITATGSGGSLFLGTSDGSKSTTIQADPTYAAMYLQSGSTYASYEMNANSTFMVYQKPSSQTKIELKTTGVTVISTTTGFQGAVYGADYSTNYTNRSLVDKAYVASQVSDIRLKENITSIESSLLKVNALRPVEFDFIQSKEHKIGFIAQEVEQVFPQLIVSDDGEYLKIKESQLVPYLVKAIQELTQKVNELEDIINKK